MSAHVQWRFPVWMAIVVAIGCGGGPSEDASATIDAATPEAPMQLAQAPADAAPAAGGSASIAGTVQFTGTAPEPEKVKMGADPVCQQQHTESVFSEDVVVNDNGTLRHVFVYVKEGLAGTFPAPEEPVVLDQAGCWYQPHVFGIQVGQSLLITNSDSTLHNVNAKPKANRPFNIAQPVQGMKTTKSFTKPELGVKFKCNVHPWMSAFAGVVEHPFFSVTDASGAFTISGLPAGTYVVEAWHEQYGTQTQTVTVADGAAASAAFSFSGE